jgi:ATP synthase protein I
MVDKARDNQSDDGAAVQPGPMDDDQLEARRRDLQAKLSTRKRKSRLLKLAEEDDTTRSGYAKAVKLSSEFIAGVTVGAILGFGFDEYFGTSPWGLIVLLLIGFAAGVLNVMRSAGVVAKPPKL